jgi:predicted transcriptional regulator
MEGMRSRRSNIQVMADILRLGEAGKTEIMYSANMSYRQLGRYLQFLTDRGFIEIIKVGNPVTTYKVNEKGLRLLENIENLLAMLGLEDEGLF